MNWATLASLGLKVVVWLIKNKLDDYQQRQLGRNEAVKDMLEIFSERVKTAKEIDADSEHWSDDDAASRVRFRDDDKSDDTGVSNGNTGGGDK